MSELPPRHPMTFKAVVLELPGMADAIVRRGLVYRETDAGSLTLDVWKPGAAAGEQGAAVVFVSGFPDPAFEQRIGCKVMEMASYESWARLIAASGIVAVTYTNREPAADFAAVLRYVHEHARLRPRSNLAGFSGDRHGRGLKARASFGNVRCAAREGVHRDEWCG